MVKVTPSCCVDLDEARSAGFWLEPPTTTAASRTFIWKQLDYDLIWKLSPCGPTEEAGASPGSQSRQMPGDSAFPSSRPFAAAAPPLPRRSLIGEFR